MCVLCVRVCMCVLCVVRVCVVCVCVCDCMYVCVCVRVCAHWVYLWLAKLCTCVTVRNYGQTG